MYDMAPHVADTGKLSINSLQMVNEALYENLNVSATLKRVFVEQIRVIYWRNKIALRRSIWQMGRMSQS